MAMSCPFSFTSRNIYSLALRHFRFRDPLPASCNLWHSRPYNTDADDYSTNTHDAKPPSFSYADKFRQVIGEPEHETPKLLCRTMESDPAKHDIRQEGLFYTIPEAHCLQSLIKAFPFVFKKLAKAFNETTLMVRKPFLEIKSYLEEASYDTPVIRYILYGRAGGGKTCTMAHVMHYAASQGWIIVHVPWAAYYNRYYRDMVDSKYKEGRYDQPIEGTAWLTLFLHTNLSILKQLNLTSKHKYSWSKREHTEVGDKIIDAINFGLSRPTYSCDIVGMVLKELKTQSHEKGFKVLVAIDGVNAFWNDTTYKKVPASALTMVHNFKKIIKNDWTNGAILCTVDDTANMADNRESFMPKYLLGDEGFNWFDPHVPIHVPNYSDKEVHSCLAYYIDRGWIQNPEGRTEKGKKQFIFLSGKNPIELFRATRAM